MNKLREQFLDSPWIFKLLVGVFFCFQISVMVTVDRLRPPSDRAQELSYLPSGNYLKVAVVGYREVTADLIWLKTIQYLGEKHQTSRGYHWAYHAANVITDLDPQFKSAYLITGMIIGVWAQMPDESIAILQKGHQNLPEVWQFPYMIGYEYYYEKNNPSTASKYFQAASRIPGAPAYLAGLAARMTVEAGDPDAALEFLQRLYQQVQDPQIREGLSNRIRQVAVERDLRHLESTVRKYHAQVGRLPRDLQDLVRAQLLTEIPVEPFGGHYELRADGVVASSTVKERVRVYRPQ